MIYGHGRTCEALRLWVQTLRPQAAEPVAIGDEVKEVAGWGPSGVGVKIDAVRNGHPVLLWWWREGRDEDALPSVGIMLPENDPTVVRRERNLKDERAQDLRRFTGFGVEYVYCAGARAVVKQLLPI